MHLKNEWNPIDKKAQLDNYNLLIDKVSEFFKNIGVEVTAEDLFELNDDSTAFRVKSKNTVIEKLCLPLYSAIIYVDKDKKIAVI